MPLTSEQEIIINTINYFTYEQYNAGWCKAASIEELKSSYKKANQQYIDNYRKKPTSEQYTQDIIQLFFSEFLMSYVPESFMYLGTLEATNWQLSENQEHIQLLEKIIDKSFFHIHQQINEAEEQKLEWLSYFGLKDWGEYEIASDEVKKEVNLPSYYRDYGFSPEGKVRLDFTEYPRLEQYFLEDLFNPQTVRYFFNIHPEQFEELIETEETIPAVIGLDLDKIALFWFNF